jgi:hypothetical protein
VRKRERKREREGGDRVAGVELGDKFVDEFTQVIAGFTIHS